MLPSLARRVRAAHRQVRVLRRASDDHGEVAALTSHDYRLGLMAEED